MINFSSLESDSMTDDIFSITASMETNYHIVSDGTDRIVYGHATHCNEVKHSISYDSEQLKK